MDKNIQKLEPQAVWNNFYLLTQQPRPSKHEEMVRAFLVNWAKERGIECETDKIGNVIMRKPATAGMENRKGVILQAHMDMVPQKNADKQHDFEADPIEAYIDGEWVTANGTTLGADNGIGVAAAMAVLEASNLKHGPVEALITTDEETGMTGAFGLEAGYLKGDILLNLDSETEGELYVGCAGGLDATIHLPLEKEAAAGTAYKLSLTGLKGGHSGMDIILYRGNANKLMNRLLLRLARELGVQLAALEGGSLRNAIPRESFATVMVPAGKDADMQKIVAEFYNETKAELALVEPDYVLKCEKAAETLATCLTLACTKRLCNLVYGIVDGVIRMSDSMPGLVETSTNMAIVKMEGEEAVISCLLRSSVDTAKFDLAACMQAVVDLAGAKAEFTGAYPGWKPNMDSPILKEMQELYVEMFGKKAEVMAIHAGLECGLLGGVYKNWDMISFGPTIKHPHSPDEKVNIESVGKFWKYLLATLENVPVK